MKQPLTNSGLASGTCSESLGAEMAEVALFSQLLQLPQNGTNLPPQKKNNGFRTTARSSNVLKEGVVRLNVAVACCGHR